MIGIGRTPLVLLTIGVFVLLQAVDAANAAEAADRGRHHPSDRSPGRRGRSSWLR